MLHEKSWPWPCSLGVEKSLVYITAVCYALCRKKIRDVFECNLKKEYQILMLHFALG